MERETRVSRGFSAQLPPVRFSYRLAYVAKSARRNGRLTDGAGPSSS